MQQAIRAWLTRAGTTRLWVQRPSGWLRRQSIGALLVGAAVSGCGGGGADDSSASGMQAGAAAASNARGVAVATAALPADEAATSGRETAAAFSSRDEAIRRAQALTVWREAGAAVRAKGSCVGCHGPDVVDLARIGTSPANIVRRATVDGASQAEAQLLAGRWRARCRKPAST